MAMFATNLCDVGTLGYDEISAINIQNLLKIHPKTWIHSCKTSTWKMTPSEA